jgi:hypothetical protein
MATAKKTTKKTEAPKEEPKEQPKERPGMFEILAADLAKKGADQTAVTLRNATPDEYINSEYPWFQTSQNIPQLLKALLREVVKGRMK